MYSLMYLIQRKITCSILQISPSTSVLVRINRILDYFCLSVHQYTLHISCAFDFNMIILKGLTIVKPVIYGNISRYFGKKRDEDGHTHQWTVYVKPYKNEVYFKR